MAANREFLFVVGLVVGVLWWGFRMCLGGLVVAVLRSGAWPGPDNSGRLGGVASRLLAAGLLLWAAGDGAWTDALRRAEEWGGRKLICWRLGIKRFETLAFCPMSLFNYDALRAVPGQPLFLTKFRNFQP